MAKENTLNDLCTMTFEDLIEKGEGKIYVVKKDNPTRVGEIDCVAVTKKVASERRYFYFGWDFNRDLRSQFILARKSKAKNNVRHDGLPHVVYITSNIPYIQLTNNEKINSSIEESGYLFYLDKEEACDYAINKIKHRKLELNACIININKLKFGT